MFLFVRTILASDDVAQHVKRIGSTWPIASSRQWHTVQLSLLLHLLPNLQVFDCAPLQACDNYELFDTFSSGLKPVAVGLQSLREIGSESVCEADEHYLVDGGASLTMLLTMMMLPSIRKIQVDLVGRDPTEDFDLTYTAQIGKSSVVDLDLRDWWMTPTTLHKILQVPRALTRFSFSATGCFPTVMDDPMFHTAIGQLRKTLEFLALDFGHLQMDEDGVPIVCHTVGSLRNWPLLTHIRSPLLPLLGIPGQSETRELGEILPRVIRRLDISLDGAWPLEDLVDEISRLAEKREVYGLTRLVNLNMTHWPFLNKAIPKRLSEACTSAGIKFRVVGQDWETEF